MHREVLKHWTCTSLKRLYGIATMAMMIAWLANSTSAEQQATVKSDIVDYGPAIARFEEVVADELKRGILSGVSAALIDDQRVVLAEGFGLADKSKQTPATADTIYRVGSISKVFTALAAMQLVEQGKLKLDDPVHRTLPSFRIIDPFRNSAPITLRQLMCHRSGMVRESPVGGYLDDSEPHMHESIASLRSCVLVNPPNTKTRYSNIGPTIVGQAIATASGCPYEKYVKENILDPLGMFHSAWQLDRLSGDRLATGYMRVADGHGGFTFRKAPRFELGTIPAGNLYSSANDMARFARMLLAEGRFDGGRIVCPATFHEMSAPQLTNEDTGFGLGFMVGRHGAHRTIQHTGAVYGFSASLVALPAEKIAVVVLANSDLVAGRVKRLSEAALDLMLNAKFGEPPPEVPATLEMDADQLAEFTGQFESSVHWAELKMADGQLTVNIAGQPMTARPIGPLKFEIDGRIVYQRTLEFNQDESGRIVGFHALGQHFSRVASEPPTIPRRWQDYLGSYGPRFIPLVVSVRHGHLYAMTENEVDYRLTPVNATVFKMPEGLYADEYLVFEQNENGQIYAVTLANMPLRRQQQP